MWCVGVLVGRRVTLLPSGQCVGVRHANLNHPTRGGEKPRAERKVFILAKGRRVGAAQVPTRTHSVPALASSPGANTLNQCKRTSRKKASQDGRPRGFLEKLPRNAEFLWTGLPYGP